MGLQKPSARRVTNPLLLSEPLSELHLIYQDSNLAFNLSPPRPDPGQDGGLTSPGHGPGFSASRCSCLFPPANTGYHEDEIGFLNSWVKH